MFREWLRQHRPDLVPRYRELYRRGAYAPGAERRRLAALLEGPDLSPWGRGRDARPVAASVRRPNPAPAQERLFDA